MKTFSSYITESKRLCKGPGCGVTTTHTIDTHPETRETVWKCGNCGHMTPKTTRMTVKKRAMDDLFDKLTKQ